MQLNQVLNWLHVRADKENAIYKAERFGIDAKHAIGLYKKDINKIAKLIKKDDDLAVQLFETGIHEARLLCAKIYTPKNLDEALMQYWVETFDNWETTDTFCMKCFAPSPLALKMATKWIKSKEEFIRRSGFVLLACFGFSRKNEENAIFESFFTYIKKYADDERNFVKKANNWALRSIGKRNVDLKVKAIATAKELLHSPSKSAQWIAKNALKELNAKNVKMQDYPRHLYRPE